MELLTLSIPVCLSMFLVARMNMDVESKVFFFILALSFYVILVSFMVL